MQKTFGIAIGAGLASALLFVASTKSAGPALLVAYLTPLPLMIATLGFGRSAGLVASVLACGLIAITLDWRPALFFAALLGFPAWWLSTLSLMARPLVVTTPPAPPSAPAPVLWYPVGRIATWGAGIVAGVVIGSGALVVWHFGGFDKALVGVSSRLGDVVGPAATAELPDRSTVREVVRLLPVLMAASAFLMLMVNLWIAGRVVEGSGLLSRPWPTLPEHFRLPRIAGAVAVAAGAGSFMGGAAGLACAVLAAAFAMAFILQGLGAAHALTRGLAARRMILATIYFITFTLVPSFVALAVLGIVDCLLPLRKRRQASKPPLPKT